MKKYGKNTYEDFEFYIRIGCETEFIYNDEEYITTFYNGMHVLLNNTTKTEQIFNNREELIEKARIDGKKLEELFTQIIVTNWS